MTLAGSDPTVLDVSGFIRGAVERAGGAVDVGAPGRLDVLLPAELEPVAGGRAWVSLALTSDAAGVDAEPATLGSPFMDALIAFAADRGTVASGYLPPGRLKRKGLREEVEQTLLFSNCRTRYVDAEPDVRLSATAQFDFKVTFLSEERRERVYVVPVNLFSNQVDLALAERLAELPVASAPESELPEAPLLPVEAAYETARRALRRLVGEEAARQQVRVRQRFGVQFARIDEYYTRAIDELERRRDRELQRSGELRRSGEASVPAPDRLDPAPRIDDGGVEHAAKAHGLAQKAEAARAERERKLRELGETYGIRTRARLASVRCLWQPKVFFKVLLDRGSITRTLVLAYDGLSERVEPPICESCRGATTRLRACSDGRLLCLACAAE